MRTYWTTTVPVAEAIWQVGWTDRYEEFGMRGVFMATIPLDANDGFDGEVTLCLDVPEDVFGKYDVTDGLMEKSGYRLALIPAGELNRLGLPQVYDHIFAGCSRRDLILARQNREVAGLEDGYPSTALMREAVAFFDRIGWLTPLRLREEAAKAGEEG
jgi:hypothetical protein